MSSPMPVATTDDLNEIVKKEIDKFKVSVGIIAISDNEYSVYANTDMAHAEREL